MRAVLDVDRSALGRRWVGPDAAEDRAALALVQASGLPEPVARVLAARGIAALDAPAFLAPTLRALTPDPSSLRDMDRAAERLVRAALRGERVALFGDYDVDGACACALMIRWLRAFGPAPTLHIPDRMTEGYGPNIPAMTRLGGAHDLVICLDCGTVAHEPIAAAVAAGAEVMVIDHHQGAETPPPALAVVNPNRQDEDGALHYLCAAGVAFLLLVAANRLLRAQGREGPDLIGLLDLVALATVADVAPLVGFNRALVRQGLAVMARRDRPGLAALADVARLTAPPTAASLGFAFGPRINAGGRLGTSDLGTRLLVTDDPHEAAALAEKLDRLNADRRAVEAQVLDAALSQAEAQLAADVEGPLVWAAAEGWHKGVVGIVAARLKERFDRPAVVIALDGVEGAGSGRSVPGADLGAAVAALAREGLILRGGGHAMAAGLSLSQAQVAPAMDRLAALLARQGVVGGAPRDLRLDGALAPAAATPDLVDLLESAGPFGAAAPAPRFALPAARITHVRPMGEGHLRLALAGGAEAVAFRVGDTALGALLRDHGGAPLHLAGRLERDDWQGRRRARLRIEDAAPVR